MFVQMRLNRVYSNFVWGARLDTFTTEFD